MYKITIVLNNNAKTIINEIRYTKWSFARIEAHFAKKYEGEWDSITVERLKLDNDNLPFQKVSQRTRKGDN